MTGVLGILIEAKRHGLIAAVKPILDALIGQVSFRVSPQLYQEVLHIAKE
jgi:predicted nucleic acid-binding protein